MYSICLINSKGKVSYLSVKGKSEWKTKRAAVKHAKDIASCNKKPWNTCIIEIENEHGELIETITTNI